jgi:peptide/nickel transport system substrate-binding protein
MPSRSSVLAAALLSLAAGVSAQQKPLAISQTFFPGSTDPMVGSTGWSLTSFGVCEKLFTVNREGQVVPQMAEKVTRNSKFEWVVTIKPNNKFSNGVTVTAQHVADALTALNRGQQSARSSLGNMTMTVLDSARVKIVSTQAVPVMDATLAEWAFPIFLKSGDSYIFSGPYAISKFVKDEKLELTPNAFYPRAAERSTILVRKSQGGAWLASLLANNTLDMAFNLPVGELQKYDPHSRTHSSRTGTRTRTRARTKVGLPCSLRDKGFTIKSFPVGYQYMMWYNMKRPALSDVRVRKALEMALDRNKLVQATRGGIPTKSLFPANTPHGLKNEDVNPDARGAARMLDDAGWVKGAGGKRAKDGVPLAVRIVAYAQRPDLVTMLPVVASEFEALGLTVTQTATPGSSWEELDAITESDDYDMLLWAQHTLPAGDPQFFMNMFFRKMNQDKANTNNHALVDSPEIEALIDALSHAEAGDRVPATALAHQAIIDLVPVSALMTPMWHVGLSQRLSSYEPWGSDYYMIRADFGLPTSGDMTFDDLSKPMATPPPRGTPSGVRACVHLRIH